MFGRRILDDIKLFKNIDKMSIPKTKNISISHGDIFKSMVGLHSLGKTDYADIELNRNDLLFKEGLKLEK